MKAIIALSVLFLSSLCMSQDLSKFKDRLVVPEDKQSNVKGFLKSIYSGGANYYLSEFSTFRLQHEGPLSSRDNIKNHVYVLRSDSFPNNVFYLKKEMGVWVIGFINCNYRDKCRSYGYTVGYFTLDGKSIMVDANGHAWWTMVVEIVKGSKGTWE